MGEIIYDSVDRDKDFSFYLEWGEEPLEDFAQRTHVFNILFNRITLLRCCVDSKKIMLVARRPNWRLLQPTIWERISGLGQDGDSRCDEKWLDSGDNLEMDNIKSLMHWV